MLVSIIIPCFNVEEYIEECVDSAFAQTYKNIEVICIDNNSTDQTWEKIQNIKTKYPSLIVDKEPKPGAPAARNKGLSMSKGEWLQFLDADDLIEPDKIKHQTELINCNPKAAFIVGACIKREINGEETFIKPKNDVSFKSLFTTQLGNTCSNLWNRYYIEQIGGWDENLKSSQEADLMFRLLQVNEEVIYDNETLTIVRERAFGQISQSNHTERWQRFFYKRIDMVNWIKTNRTEHYKKEIDYYNDAMFGILKIMAKEDNGYQVAIQLQKKHLYKYKPSRFQTHSTRSYIFLYKLFGFNITENIRRVLNQL